MPTIMSPSTPLLKNNATSTSASQSASDAYEAPRPPTALARGALLALGAARIVLGTALLVAPGRTLGLFGLSSSLTAESRFMVRAMGAREAVLGDLVVFADRGVASR